MLEPVTRLLLAYMGVGGTGLQNQNEYSNRYREGLLQTNE